MKFQTQNRLASALLLATILGSGLFTFANLNLNGTRTFVYQGRLENNNVLVNTPRDFRFVLATTNAAQDCITQPSLSTNCGHWQETQVNLTLDAGVFSAVVGSDSNLYDDDLSSDRLYLSIAVKEPASSTWSKLGAAQEVHPAARANHVAEMNDYQVETLSVTGGLSSGPHDVTGDLGVSGAIDGASLSVTGNVTGGSEFRLAAHGNQAVVKSYSGSVNGIDLGIGGGNLTVIGGGEAADSLLTEAGSALLPNNEDLVLAADNAVRVMTVPGNNGANAAEQMSINSSGTTLYNSLKYDGDSNGCPSDMDRIGSSCIDKSMYTSNDKNYSEAIDYCDAKGRDLCELPVLIACDVKNLRLNTPWSCGWATDAGSATVARILTGTIYVSGSFSQNVFSNVVCYDPSGSGGGGEVNNSLDKCDEADDEGFFCCQPANMLHR